MASRGRSPAARRARARHRRRAQDDRQRARTTDMAAGRMAVPPQPPAAAKARPPRAADATPPGHTQSTAVLGARRRASSELRMVPLVWIAVGIAAFFVPLFAVAPVGGVSLSISPLAHAWPWLLWPSRLLFGAALVDASVVPTRGWPALALLDVTLVGASCVAALAPLYATRHAADSFARSARRHMLLLVLGGALALGLVLALLPALPSDDIFSYILYGRISAVHGANPLVAVPSDFPHDPFLTLVYWRNVRSVYGSVWLLLSSGVTLLARALGGSLAVSVALFKLLGLAAHLVNIVLIWAILGRLAPRRQLTGALLYGWNPLCLLEFAASAHNDAVMLTFLLLAIYFLVRRWRVAAMIALGLSIAVKYMPVALLPLYLVFVWRELAARHVPTRARLGALAWRTGLVASVVTLTTLPYWDGVRTFSALLYSPPAQSLDNSISEGISWPLRWLAQGLGMVPHQASIAVDAALKGVALLAFAGLWLWQFRRARSLEGMLVAWGWVLLWYSMVASGWFWPWYVTWAVVVVALLPWQSLTTATLLLAGSALTLYGFLALQSAGIYGYRAAVVFGPPLAYLALRAWRRRHPTARRKGGASGARAATRGMPATRAPA